MPKAPGETPSVGLALRTFLAVAEQWALPLKSRLLLLGIAKRTYTVWLKRLDENQMGDMDGDKLDRIAFVLAIYELAGNLFPDGVAWLTRPNRAPVFQGRRPLDRMLDGHMEDLMETLSYLKTASMGLLPLTHSRPISHC